MKMSVQAQSRDAWDKIPKDNGISFLRKGYRQGASSNVSLIHAWWSKCLAGGRADKKVCG
jgi:hypothetical protein